MFCSTNSIKLTQTKLIQLIQTRLTLVVTILTFDDSFTASNSECKHTVTYQ